MKYKLNEKIIKNIKKWRVDFENNFIESNVFPFYVYPSKAVVYLLQTLCGDDKKLYKKLRSMYCKDFSTAILCSDTIFWILAIYWHLDETVRVDIDTMKDNKTKLITSRKEIINIDAMYKDNFSFYCKLYDSMKKEKRDEALVVLSTVCISLIREYERFIYEFLGMKKCIKMVDTQIFIEGDIEYDTFVNQKKVVDPIVELKAPIHCTPDKTWLYHSDNKGNSDPIIIAMITKKKLDIIGWKNDNRFKFVTIPKKEDNPALYFLLKKKNNQKLDHKYIIDVWVYYYNYCELIDEYESLNLINGFIKI